MSVSLRSRAASSHHVPVLEDPTQPARLRRRLRDRRRRSAPRRRAAAAGYRNIHIDDSWREPLRVTRIVAQQGDDGSASAIRRQLGFGEVRVESTGSLTSDVTIQLGEDWLQKQASSEKGFINF